MGDLLFNLMNKFCKNGSVYEDSMSSIKSTSDLLKLMLPNKTRKNQLKTLTLELKPNYY